MAPKKRLTRKQLRRGIWLRGGAHYQLVLPRLLLLPLINIKMHASATEPAMLVTKAYTQEPRMPVELKCTRRFAGEGTFTCDSKDVEFFLAQTGGTALKFDGTDNVFTPKALAAGQTLFAEAKKPGEANLKLELSRPVGRTIIVETKLFLVELTLDICEPRAKAGKDPKVLDQPPKKKPKKSSSDKFYGGRPLPLQDSQHQQERAMLIVQPVKPASFRGKLVLERINDEVELFTDEEFVSGEAARPHHSVLDSDTIDAKGERFFVQAVKKSGSVLGTGYRLGLESVAKEGDIVKMTSVEAEVCSNVEETDLHIVERVPEKPARTPISKKFMPAPRIVGVKYDVELRAHLDLVKVKSQKWSTAAGNISLKKDTKEVVKLKATADSGAVDDVIIENLIETEHGKMKLMTKMTAVTVEIKSVGSGDSVTSTDDLNKIANPAACIILAGTDASDAKKVPIYKITKITPAAITFTDDDERISWWVIGGDGDYPGKAKFMATDAAKRGKKVQLHGTTKGDVLIEPYSGGYAFGMYRAHAVANHKVKFRVNRLLFAGDATATPVVPARAPTASVADAKKHMKVVNIYLRQAAIEMVPDDSAEVAKKTGNNKVGQAAQDPRVVSVNKVSDGYFDVTVDRARLVFGATNTNSLAGIRINCRNEVMSFAYIHSQSSAGALATALLCPVNHAPKARADPPRAYTKSTYTLKDKGTPSSSLIPKSGLPGDTPTGTVKLIVLFPDVGWEGSTPATRDDDLLWGVIVPTSSIDGSAGPHTKELAFGNTMAHEIGHVLGLGHRGLKTDPVTDGLALPSKENLMHPSEAPPTAQDIDIIQVKAIRFSEVLHRTP